ncbi:MAG: hypothetical protein ACREMO_09020, partial [Gemmatimonadales bacterium]
HRLAWEVYHYQTASRARPHGWVDAPSSSILQLYSVVFTGEAQVALARGDSTSAARADSIANEVVANITSRRR